MKSNYNRFSMNFRCQRNKSVKKKPMTPVYTIKDAKCNDGRIKIKILISFMNDHDMNLFM